MEKGCWFDELLTFLGSAYDYIALVRLRRDGTWEVRGTCNASPLVVEYLPRSPCRLADLAVMGATGTRTTL